MLLNLIYFMNEKFEIDIVLWQKNDYQILQNTTFIKGSWGDVIETWILEATFSCIGSIPWLMVFSVPWEYKQVQK